VVAAGIRPSCNNLGRGDIEADGRLERSINRPDILDLANKAGSLRLRNSSSPTEIFRSRLCSQKARPNKTFGGEMAILSGSDLAYTSGKLHQELNLSLFLPQEIGNGPHSRPK
jgi:hypothetical protein